MKDPPRILIDYRGAWGLGDLLCSEPMVRGLRERHGPRAEIRYRGKAGNVAFSPEVAGEAGPDFRADHLVEVSLFTEMPLDRFAALEALPSLVEHMGAYAGPLPSDRNPRLDLGIEELEFLGKLPIARLPRPLVAICADDFDPYRSWPVERFARLAAHIKARGASVLELGLKRRLGVGTDLVGLLPIRGAAALLSTCDLFVGNNSGLFHYAQAADVPCVTFFSLALPERFIHDDRLVLAVQNGDLPCIDCMTRDLVERTRRGCYGTPDGACMRGLSFEQGRESVDLVFEAYLEDCGGKGQEGIRARSFRAGVYADQAKRLLHRGHTGRARDFLQASLGRLGGEVLPRGAGARPAVRSS